MGHKVRYEQTLNAPLDKVWAIASDFSSLLDWVSGGNEGSISVSGKGIGMTRTLTLPSVGEVQHRLDQLDDDRHLVTYSLTAGHPLGMSAYSVSFWLESLGAEKCQIRWEGSFAPAAGENVESMSSGLANAYRDMSERLETLAGRK